jgi:hypothetical protein
MLTLMISAISFGARHRPEPVAPDAIVRGTERSSAGGMTLDWGRNRNVPLTA